MHQAVAVSAHLQLPLLDADEERYDFLLCCNDDNAWFLCQTLRHKRLVGDLGQLQIDFAQGTSKHRLLHGGGNGQMIAKAVGIAHKKQLRVLDCTAGFGKDAFVLASLGCQVEMYEKNILIHFLLQQALSNALQNLHVDARILTSLNKMQCHHGDALQLLQQEAISTSANNWHVIYLDPMFPERSKSAKVKKDMQYLQYLLAAESVQQSDCDARLLARALDSGCYRVVVKRPAHAPNLAGINPSYALKGKSTRFDIYALKTLKAEY